MRNRYFLALDLPLIALAAFGSFVLRFDWFFLTARAEFGAFLLVALMMKPPTLYVGGIYSRYWQYATTGDMLALLLSVSAASAVVSVVIPILLAAGLIDSFSRSVVVIDWLLTLLFVAGPRLSARLEHDLRSRAKPSQAAKNVIVAGAGNAGMMVVREIQRNPRLGKNVVGFVDDDVNKVGKQIHGVPVVGRLSELESAASKHRCDEVVIAMPTAPGPVVRQVADRCRQLGLRSLTIPGMYELLDSPLSVSTLREVDITDLLRRSPAGTQKRAHRYITGRRVLVTGAGGSIGGELCRQIAHLDPARLVSFDHGENSLFELAQDLGELVPSLDHSVVVGDIRDEERVQQIFRQFRPDVVFHAAAHKHVGLMEQNWNEALTNNVLGTHRIVTAAVDVGVQRFVLVSTDKAVRPVGVMGASKRVAEELVRHAAARTGHGFVIVRFGNVLGSRGSVVPTFKRQLQRGGPITITDSRMRRYFMTIPEAVHLMLEAGGFGRGGELYVLRMGEPVAIVDLARDLIQLSGYSLDQIPIIFTGSRPGEKLTESLWDDGAALDDTEHPEILRVTEPPPDFEDIRLTVETMVKAVERRDWATADTLLQSWFDRSAGVAALSTFPDANRTGRLRGEHT